MIFARGSRALGHLPFFISLCGNPGESTKTAESARMFARLPPRHAVSHHPTSLIQALLMLLWERKRKREKNLSLFAASPRCYHRHRRFCRCHRCQPPSVVFLSIPGSFFMNANRHVKVGSRTTRWNCWCFIFPSNFICAQNINTKH